MVSAAGDFVYAKFSEVNVITVKCNDSVSFSFLFPCFFFFVKDQIASFQLKQIVVFFELSVPCVYLFHCVIATEFDYGIITGSEYCMQLVV